MSAAAAHPGCIAVYTADDLFPLLINPYWGGWEGTARAEGSPLARNKVRWVGEPVAAILANSRYEAEDIAELVDVSYEPLPAVTDPEKALEPDSAVLYDEWDSNTYFHDEFECGDLAGAFERADGVVKRRFTAARHTGTPLETRGIVAEYDSGLESLTIQCNFQDVYLARAIIAEVLDMPPSQVRVASPDSGGGFGVKLPVYPEELAVACLSLKERGPIKWIQDRQEDLIGTSQHRDLIIEAEAPYSSDGKMLGLKVRIVSDGGAYGVPARGNTVEGMMAAEDLVAGGHDIKDYAYVLDVAMTNKPPTCVYRGVAQPVTVFALDSLMDAIAEETGVNRGEVRRRNLIKQDQFPYETATKGYVMEPGSYEEALNKALELIGFDEWPEYQAKMRAGGPAVRARDHVRRRGRGPRRHLVRQARPAHLGAGGLPDQDRPHRSGLRGAGHDDTGAGPRDLARPAHRRRARRRHRRRPRDHGRHRPHALRGGHVGQPLRHARGQRGAARVRGAAREGAQGRGRPPRGQPRRPRAREWARLGQGRPEHGADAARGGPHRVLRGVRSSPRHRADAGGGAPLRPAVGHVLELDPRDHPRGRSRAPERSRSTAGCACTTAGRS